MHDKGFHQKPGRDGVEKHSVGYASPEGLMALRKKEKQKSSVCPFLSVIFEKLFARLCLQDQCAVNVSYIYLLYIHSADIIRFGRWMVSNLLFTCLFIFGFHRPECCVS